MPYRDHPLRNATVTEVQPDPQRLFLVVSGTRSRTGQPWTLVLERQNDYWISRRDVAGLFSPEEAVTGFLFSREGYQDPVDMLRRMNEVVRAEYYRVLQEKMKGDRTRTELTEELARVKDEVQTLQGRRLERGRGTGRRAAAAPRKTPPSRRRRRAR